VKISEALAKSKIELEKNGVGNVGLDSLILLCHALSFSKERVIFNPDIELSSEQEAEFFNLVSRRAKREPISHLIGKREFYGVDFTVSKDTLDPRPDSETLIESVLKKCTKFEEEIAFLEVGVGSGCLIISLLLLYKRSSGLGLDISSPAIEIAQKNAKANLIQDRVNFLKSDLFSSLNSNQKFDVIVSNPPYIPSADILELEPEVKDFEPMLALDGGVDGLDFYRRIASDAGEFLKDEGRIFLEIGIGQRLEIEKIFEKSGFKLLTVSKDLSGIERVLEFIL
jgi:release factor glutamine methyltransferase